ncbi:glycosyltransferase family 2 protein [uncultured Muribaculum sp.]|uniref:glycosyltransferase family 2 protein n=1 Tax=uncultured Muribaculum sp. TaxID=1918613 RepID=UPI00261CE344|nr:glycosyltransferase family 2 protein [uncultured Muribaculum sp.]
MNTKDPIHNHRHTIPLVTIIVPAYNYARYIDARMESILNQTFQDFEIILLDDHSSDDSACILEKYRHHPKVSHIEVNRENSGSPFRQWKKGISYARGKYIWIAEADDSAKPEFLEKTVEAMESNPSASLAFTGSNLIDADGHAIARDWDKWDTKRQHDNRRRKIFHGGEYIVHNLFWKNYIYNASMVLFRRDSYSSELIEASISMRNAGDWMFWVRMAEKGDVIEIHEKLNYFRRHSDSTTVAGDTSGRIRMEEIDVLNYIINRYPVGNYRKTLRIGQFIKSIHRSKQYSKQTRRKILNSVNTILSAGKGTYLLERMNKAIASICPFLLTRSRDRL